MKKLISVFLAAMMALSLSACGSGSDTGARAASGAASGSAASEPEDGSAAADSAPAAPAAADISIEEQVLLDDTENGFKITAVSLGANGDTGSGSDDGLRLKLLCENSSEKEYGISFESGYVNGCAFVSYAGDNIAAGKKANLSVIIPSSTLNACGITEIGDISLIYSLRETESYQPIHDRETLDVHVSDNGTVVNAAAIDGETVYDENGITVKICPVIDDGRDDNYTFAIAAVLVENQSSSFVSLSLDNISVNDFMCDYGIYFENPTLAPNTLCYGNLLISPDYLEDDILEDTNTLEFSLLFYDIANYNTIGEVEGITADFTL